MGYVAETECFRENHCRVLTPDGGQICCSTPAEAARVAADMDRLRALNAELVAALKNLLTVTEESGLGIFNAEWDACQKARAALAAAEREAP